MSEHYRCVRFSIQDGIEMATMMASDFRAAMQERDHEEDRLRRENQRLLVDNAELSTECDQWQVKVADLWREIDQLRQGKDLNP